MTNLVSLVPFSVAIKILTKITETRASSLPIEISKEKLQQISNSDNCSSESKLQLISILLDYASRISKRECSTLITNQQIESYHSNAGQKYTDAEIRRIAGIAILSILCELNSELQEQYISKGEFDEKTQ